MQANLKCSARIRLDSSLYRNKNQYIGFAANEIDHIDGVRTFREFGLTIALLVATPGHSMYFAMLCLNS